MHGLWHCFNHIRWKSCVDIPFSPIPTFQCPRCSPAQFRRGLHHVTPKFTNQGYDMYLIYIYIWCIWYLWFIWYIYISLISGWQKIDYSRVNSILPFCWLRKKLAKCPISFPNPRFSMMNSLVNRQQFLRRSQQESWIAMELWKLIPFFPHSDLGDFPFFIPLIYG